VTLHTVTENFNLNFKVHHNRHGYVINIDQVHLIRRSFSILLAILVIAAVWTPVAAAKNSAFHAGSKGLQVLSPAVGIESRSPRGSPAQYHLILRQYHEISGAIPRQIARSIGAWKCCSIFAQISRQGASEPRPAQSPSEKSAQYQRTSGQYQDDGLMLRIGGVLALAYLAFLGIWIWATRFRPH
jgi:hypothetical protein